jgi:hypothetical protein
MARGLLSMRGVAAGIAVLAACVLSGAPLAAAPAGGAIDGTVQAVDAASVTVATPGGAVRAAITADTRIIRRQAARFEQIRPRDFVGVAARRASDGTLVAVAINIFPPEFKGRVREGQFPMETGNLMTNAVVFQNVRRIEGRTLYLTFPEGTAVINVGADAEIFRLTVMRPTDLRVGMRVALRATGAPGALAAATITVDETGR